MHTYSLRAAIAIGVVILSLSLAACGNADNESGASTARASTLNCQLPQPTIKSDTPTIAILGAEGAALQPYAQDTDVVISTAKTTKARVIVNGVSGGSEALNLLSNVILEGEGDNNLARTKDLNCKAAKVGEALDTLERGKTAERLNVFDALNALSGTLSGNPSKQPVDVVLLTPLVAQGGGISLTDSKTLADPVSAINTLAAKGLIPRCENWRIYGVSPSTGLSDQMAAQLKEFWIRYTRKCGGTLVAWTDHLATFPATNSIVSADTSQITVERTAKEITGTLGSDVLFGAYSATLLDSAEPALAELLDLITKYPGTIVITGYVNPVDRADPEMNRTLSLQRATAVRDWLIAHGVDDKRMTVIGQGAADPVYPRPTTDAQGAANRRVVAVIHSET